MKIYLAGPITGSSYEDVVGKIRAKKQALPMFECLSPMTGKEYLRNEIKFKAEGWGGSVSTNHAVVERDKWMVEQSDIVYADLTGATIVSIGTCMELAWASLLGKHTVVAMEKDNIHRHAFVLEAADIVFEMADEAIEYLRQLA